MKSKINQSGGSFLVQSFYGSSIYSREKFNQEHLDIEQMIKDFSRKRIFPNKHKVDNYDKELSLKLIQEAGELGLLGIEVPEEYGGIDLDLTTSAINLEAITYGYSFSFLAIFNPFPPPPIEAFMSTGYPISFDILIALSSLLIGSSDPGTTARPSSRIFSLAFILFPIVFMCS